MIHKPSTNIETMLLLPLDVVANKLVRIEEELRQLSRKAQSFEVERAQGSLARLFAARLDNIYDRLDSIRILLSTLEDDSAPASTDDPEEIAQLSPAHHKPYPELDD